VLSKCILMHVNCHAKQSEESPRHGKYDL